MSQRIKGQEVEIVVVVNGSPKRSITAVRSFEVAFQMDILAEGYLGETTKRKDSIFNGSRGKLDVHIENAEIFGVIQQITDRARRRGAGLTINIKATLRFPNGDRPKILLPDVEFGEIPLNFSSRVDYGTISLTFEGSELSVIS